jgi:hypothetical protein
MGCTKRGAWCGCSTQATSDTAERPQSRFPKGAARRSAKNNSPPRGHIEVLQILFAVPASRARLPCAPRISRAQLRAETGRQRLRATLVEPGRCGRLPHRPCGQPCRGRPYECAPAIRRGSRRASGTRETKTQLMADLEIGSRQARTRVRSRCRSDAAFPAGSYAGA